MKWQVIFGTAPVNVRVYADGESEAEAVDAAVRLTLETAEQLYGWVAEQRGRGMVVAINISPVHQRAKEEITAKYGKGAGPRPPGAKGDDFQLTDDAK